VRLAPRSAHALATLARAYAARGDGAAAVQAATAASAADVGSAAAHNNRGVLLADVGRHADAVEAFDAALAIRETAEALVNKAVSTAHLGSLGDAKRILDDALRLDSGHARAKANLQVVVRRLALQTL
jgi:Tfp pilus assembly protein PilF